MEGEEVMEWVTQDSNELSTDYIEPLIVFVLFVVVRVVAPPKLDRSPDSSPEQNRYISMIYMIWAIIGMWSRQR